MGFEHYYYTVESRDWCEHTAMVWTLDRWSVGHCTLDGLRE